jgi:DNA-binding transcriptional ArsR family regulator
MIRIHFDARDLGRIRLATSPLAELVFSVLALSAWRAPLRYGPWVSEARRAVAGLDLEPITDLVRLPDGVPDFAVPPPGTAHPHLDDQLDQVRATPAEVVRADLAAASGGRVPEQLAAYERDPAAALARLARTCQAYWTAAVEPHWPRIEEVLEADLRHRADRLAAGGLAGLFGDLHERVRLRGGVLEVAKCFQADLYLQGRGLVLVPTFFSWPRLLVTTERPWQPAIGYHPIGLARAFDRVAAPPAPALAELVGQSRAVVIRNLAEPVTTDDLARRLGVSGPAVSQQLTRLRRAGVVTSTRHGYRVLYRLTPEGQALLRLFGKEPTSAQA